MYGMGQTLGTATPAVAGIVALPATGGNTIFTIAAYAAIVIGVTALALQLGVGFYRLSARSK